VFRRQVVNDACGAGPEGIGVDAGAGNGFVVYEVEQDFGDLQATDLNALSHHLPHLNLCDLARTQGNWPSCSPSRRILHEAFGNCSAAFVEASGDLYQGDTEPQRGCHAWNIWYSR